MATSRVLTVDSNSLNVDLQAEYPMVIGTMDLATHGNYTTPKVNLNKEPYLLEDKTKIDWPENIADPAEMSLGQVMVQFHA